MKIFKKEDKIIIEIPYWSKRYNPYMPDDFDAGKHNTLIGYIGKDKDGNREMGFTKAIDMAYKGKADQWTPIMIHWWEGEPEEFKKICEELEIDCVKEL